MVSRLVCLKERAGLLPGFSRCGNGRRLCAIEHGVRAAGAHIENGEADGSDHEDDCGPGGEPGKHVCRCAGAEGSLRSLTAEGASEIGRAALLQQDYADEKEATNYVESDYEIEENLHFPGCFRSDPIPEQENFGAEEGT